MKSYLFLSSLNKRGCGCITNASYTLPISIPNSFKLQKKSSLSSTSKKNEAVSTEPQPQDNNLKPREQQRSILIPTQHSTKGPPPVCRDPNELKDLTQKLLETPIGSLYCQDIQTTTFLSNRGKGSNVVDINITEHRNDAYAAARESSEIVEYILRGYNRSISPMSLWSDSNSICDEACTASTDPSIGLKTMIDIMDRFHDEGEMYHKIRQERLNHHFDSACDDGKLKSNEEEGSIAQESKISNYDFAIPGTTTNMYDTILDAVACTTQLSLEQEENNVSSSSSYVESLKPSDVYRVASAALEAHDLNNLQIRAANNNASHGRAGGDIYFFAQTLPTMVTYNATLRGIANICTVECVTDKNRRPLLDEGLTFGFGIYNHLTHNDFGLPKRNASSIIYLLRIIRSSIPPSRTRGNMTVAIWHQASIEGLVTNDLIDTIHELHTGQCNGAEFDVFLQSINDYKAKSSVEESSASNKSQSTISPQRFARFAKKYRHSKFY